MSCDGPVASAVAVLANTGPRRATTRRRRLLPAALQVGQGCSANSGIARSPGSPPPCPTPTPTTETMTTTERHRSRGPQPEYGPRGNVRPCPAARRTHLPARRHHPGHSRPPRPDLGLVHPRAAAATGMPAQPCSAGPGAGIRTWAPRSPGSRGRPRVGRRGQEMSWHRAPAGETTRPASRPRHLDRRRRSRRRPRHRPSTRTAAPVDRVKPRPATTASSAGPPRSST